MGWVRAATLSRVREPCRSRRGLSRLEVACAVPLLVLTVLLGIFPQAAIAYIEPSIARIIALATDPSFVVLK